ncbi:unnamed protein product, partial [Polarella glacialis]
MVVKRKGTTLKVRSFISCLGGMALMATASILWGNDHWKFVVPETPNRSGGKSAVAQSELPVGAKAVPVEVPRVPAGTGIDRKLGGYGGKELAEARSTFLCTIFTLWEYPKGPPLFKLLNVETWRRHSNGLCNEPVLINDDNVRTFIPDMPDEYFRLPYPAAKSDVIRYALIYHHGGIYMDSDFIVVKDLDPVIGLIPTYDLVAYADRGSTTCDKTFSSNFIGGRKGSSFHKAVWERQKAAMRKHCLISDKIKETVCCFDDPKEQCHIPWSQIGEGMSHAVMLDPALKMTSYCFSDEKSFVPQDFLRILEHHNRNIEGALAEWRLASVEDPMDRIMYHTFNAISAWSQYSCAQLTDTGTVMGELMAKSFRTSQGTQVSNRGKQTDLFLQKHPYFRPLSETTEAVPGDVPCAQSKALKVPFAPAPQETPAPQATGTAVPPEPCYIFTLWEYPSAPLYTRLNVETWRRHSQHLCHEPVLINKNNVLKWIPDMPEEFFKMPYHAATSDLIRYGLLFHHGGIYMDADFILMNDLGPVVSRIAHHDLISYAQNGNGKTTCSDEFSSNFIAGRKGSIFMKTVWEKQKALITKHCPLSDKPKEKICCFDEPRQECHIPFAGLGEGTSHAVLNIMRSARVPFTSYCFVDEQAFVPDHFAYVLEHVSDLKEAEKYLTERNIHRGFDRLAFHLFNSILPFKHFDCKKLFDPETVIGNLYTRTFSKGRGAEPVRPNPEFLLAYPGFREFSVNSEGGWPCKGAAGKAKRLKTAPASEPTDPPAPTEPPQPTKEPEPEEEPPEPTEAPEPEEATEPEEAQEEAAEKDPESSQVRPGTGPAAATEVKLCKIFTLWNFDGIAPLSARIAVESWRRHSHGLCEEPILVTDKNVKEHVPDMPPEYFRLPYTEAKADFIRWGLVANNGGLFLEADVLLTSSLEPVVKLLGNDLVSFQDNVQRKN